MKKTEKRPYLHPTTEVVRFNVEDIITTSPYVPETVPDGGYDIENSVEVNQPDGGQ